MSNGTLTLGDLAVDYGAALAWGADCRARHQKLIDAIKEPS